MLLYVNGDSHSAGAETAGPWCFAEDDGRYRNLGRAPHPDNLVLSYGQLLANQMDCRLICDAESASSNHRIIRTTLKHLIGVQSMPVVSPDFIVIGWSTWERKEFHDPKTGIVWQINAGGIGDDWPEWLKEQYPKYIAELDWDNEMAQAHSKIYQFHTDLHRRGIKHLFFNTYSYFDTRVVDPLDWHNCYIDPYTETGTYYNWCMAQGFKTVNEHSYHFGADAHRAWANHLYAQIVQMYLTSKS